MADWSLLRGDACLGPRHPGSRAASFLPKGLMPLVGELIERWPFLSGHTRGGWRGPMAGGPSGSSTMRKAWTTWDRVLRRSDSAEVRYLVENEWAQSG